MRARRPAGKLFPESKGETVIIRNRGGRSEAHAKLDLGFILKVELTRFADELDISNSGVSSVQTQLL